MRAGSSTLCEFFVILYLLPGRAAALRSDDAYLGELNIESLAGLGVVAILVTLVLLILFTIWSRR